jgi:hypothetical protein
MDFSKRRPQILHEIEYFVFHNYFVFFGKKILPKFTFSGPIRFIVISSRRHISERNKRRGLQIRSHTASINRRHSLPLY